MKVNFQSPLVKFTLHQEPFFCNRSHKLCEGRAIAPPPKKSIYYYKKRQKEGEKVCRAKDEFSGVLLKRGPLKCGEDCRLDSTFTQEMSLPFLFYVYLHNSQLDSVLCQKGIFLSAESLYLLLFLSAEIWIRRGLAEDIN